MMKRIAIGLMCILPSEAALAVTPVDTEESVATSVAETREPSARVISCAVRFPLDSVKFSEDQVHRCLAQVDMDQVSYIHVIATASSSGSGRHNLYLSTRRAGAIEAFLNNRYPHISVHAFGGGENPKFGKVARIFVVEHQQSANDIAQGVQVAAMGPPEVIERTTTKVVTKTEYRVKPPRNFGLRAFTGPAVTTFSPDIYTHYGIEFSYFTPWVDMGLRHRTLGSNEVLDVHSTTLYAGKSFAFAQLLSGTVSITPAIESGWVQANLGTWEWGGSGTLDWSDRGTTVSLMISRSNYITAAGLGVGTRL